MGPSMGESPMGTLYLFSSANAAGASNAIKMTERSRAADFEIKLESPILY